MGTRTAEDLLEAFQTWPTSGPLSRTLNVSVARVHELRVRGQLRAIQGPLGTWFFDPQSVASLIEVRRQQEKRLGRQWAEIETGSTRMRAKIGSASR
jgi:hypothetical protein